MMHSEEGLGICHGRAGPHDKSNKEEQEREHRHGWDGKRHGFSDTVVKKKDSSPSGRLHAERGTPERRCGERIREGHSRRQDEYDIRRSRDTYDVSASRQDKEKHGHGRLDMEEEHRQTRRDATDDSRDARHRRLDIDEEHRHRRRDATDDSRDLRHHEGSRRDRSPNWRRALHDRRGELGERYAGTRQDESELSRHGVHTGRNDYHGRMRDKDEEGGKDSSSARFKRNEDELPELFSIHRAKVRSVQPFGIFVSLEGFYKQGLVHLSQLSDHEVTDREDSDAVKVQSIAAVAGEDDLVWVKVISLKDEGGKVKIGCSLKLVSQSNGKDLDPNNVKLEQQQPKGNRQEPKKVTLDAIYNVACSRCGGHGHLKTECYALGNKSYELLPEDDDDMTEQLAQPSQGSMGSGDTRIKPGFGRGRAMVLPAWMTNGSGAGVPQQVGSELEEKKKKKRKSSELPDSVTTVEEALALIAQVKKKKKDRHHRKEHKKHKKEKKLKKSSKKKSTSRNDED